MNYRHNAGRPRAALCSAALAGLMLMQAGSCPAQAPPSAPPAAAAPASVTLPPAAAQPYNEGLEFATAGNFAAAKAKFEEALAVAPEFAPAHYNLGLVLRSLGTHAEAAESFRSALDIDPEHSLARRFFAESLMAIPDYIAALPELEHAIEADSTRAPLFYARALALQNLYGDQPERVIEAWELALRQGPGEPGAYPAANSIARLHLGLGNLDLAAEAYDRAARVDPGNPEPYYNKAVVLNRQGRFEEATHLLRKAIELRSPNGIAAFLLAGIYYRELQDDGKALEYYEMAAADSAFARADQAASSAAQIREYLRRKEEQRRREE